MYATTTINITTIHINKLDIFIRAEYTTQSALVHWER
jgi:hypothetical protein